MWAGRLFSNTATQVQSVTIGWWVYTLARHSYDERISAFLVGMIGLAQFLPMFLLALVAGAVVDRYDRRLILFGCYVLQAACALIFTLLSLSALQSLIPIFIVACLFGVSRTFGMPAGASLLSALVPRDVLPKAVAWNTLCVQGGTILGPLLGGWLAGISVTAACGLASASYAVSCLTGALLLRMDINAKPPRTDVPRLTMIREGLLHLWDSKIVLGAISLDLFAVLLGGVTSLLPVYARDILHIGSQGFGDLRAAFAVGAGLMTLLLATRPIARHAGMWMLGGVALYGVATMVFALSQNMALSLAMLAVAGVADSISVFVRQNLVQIVVPDHMRGRVSAVSGLFISASNELGEFESGVAARLLGVVGAAVFGGAGSIAVTMIWARIFPALRRADHIKSPDL